ncbi:hypothetical protein BDV95DRAFT_543153 [Massariosphaeria phaeospora]|uniref:Impact N-terminal domain-containing protein n=1 Tax=Massariosphaeria phaeospora TaxID=100035 RepID=A0A7C8IA00_9PLEO|nr:hypothetical protein BDV95DRAFT_543153 [Massariosphaeria phaeospora]
MASAQDIQSLLRFLSQDAKLPLAQAMGKIEDLKKAGLIMPSTIAKAELGTLKAIFADDKLAKQVLNAAKRVSKKRSSSDTTAVTPSKKPKPSYGEPLTPAQLEDSLALPQAELDENELTDAIIYTNRAPLVLAFGVTLLRYTMPGQPLSSRLSLAQAAVSANSRTKAVNIGIESGRIAEEEGWGEGQPIVKVMGRDIRVMKRWGYTWDAKEEEGSTQDTLKAEPSGAEEPALWAIDLEARKKSNLSDAAGPHRSSSTQLPIYTAQSARAYLLKSFEPSPERAQKAPTKKVKAVSMAEKERNLGRLLGALELLFESWSSTLSKDDLDKRAWGWYVRVRPEVEPGAAGWGGKGNVKLSEILALRRPAD